jgi:hypothetical protein
MARLALAALLLTSCATTVPGGPSAVAPGMKRVTQDRPHRMPSMLRRVLRDRADRSEQRRPLHHWSGVADCESNGDPHINTGNGYFGYLQESQRFWVSFGGLRFAPRPDLATELEQITVAERGLAAQGIGAWPICGRYIRTAS